MNKTNLGERTANSDLGPGVVLICRTVCLQNSIFLSQQISIIIRTSSTRPIHSSIPLDINILVIRDILRPARPSSTHKLGSKRYLRGLSTEFRQQILQIQAVPQTTLTKLLKIFSKLSISEVCSSFHLKMTAAPLLQLLQRCFPMTLGHHL